MRLIAAALLLLAVSALSAHADVFAAQPDEEAAAAAAPDAEDGAEAAAAPVKAAPKEPAPPPKIPLDPRLRFVIRPTILGLVPLRDPSNFGEALVRVREASEERLLVHYEIKEQLPRIALGDTEARDGAAFETGLLQGETVIRRGEISAAGLDSSVGFSCPLFWNEGNWTTEGSLLWLSRGSYAQLAAGQPAAWSAGFNAGEGEMPEGFAEYIALLRQSAGLPENAALELNLISANSLCPCVVNGKRSMLPAVYARDNIGLAEYWINADAENPLLLKMNYLPGRTPSAGEFSAGQELGFAGFVWSGGGYTLTEINF